MALPAHPCVVGLSENEASPPDRRPGFEDKSPVPARRRIVGRAQWRRFGRSWFARDPDAHFEAEELIVSGNRVVVRWGYSQDARWRAVASSAVSMCSRA